jgi:tetratricopeptide (TPR) repeat protein
MSKKIKKTTPSVSQTHKPAPQSPQTNRKPVQTPKMVFWGNTRLQAILLFALSFLLYANTLGHDYCQDDAIVITENMYTQKGIAGIGGILSEDTFYGFFKEGGKDALVAGGRYRPFTLIMFAIEYQIFGKNPFIGHLVNVLLFGLTCVLLYFLLLKLISYRQNTIGKSSESATDAETSRIAYPIFIALAASLIFVAHPIHTEAVANIKGRDEIMTLLGSLAAVWFALKAFEEGGLKNYALTFGCFFIGLMSKENAITFVLIVPLVFWFFLNTNWATAFRQTIPFAAASVLFLVLRGMAIGNQFGGEQVELMNNPFLKLVGNQYVPFDFGEKTATILYTLGKYIQLLIFPHPLTHDYYPRHIGIMQWTNGPVLLSAVVYAALGYWILRGWRRRDLISFGIAFFLITLSIVSNIVFPVGTNMAERFMFMPSVGFALVVAVVLAKILRGQILIITLATIALLMSIKTVTRNMAWRDNYTIFTTDIKVSENSAKLQTSVGGETIEKFKNSPDATVRNAKIEEAISHLQKALEIHPPYKNPYLLMGNAYFYLKKYEESFDAYNKALALDPNFKDAKNNLQLAYREAGRELTATPETAFRGMPFLQKALELNPNDATSMALLAKVVGVTGSFATAIEMLERAIQIEPDNTLALSHLGTAYGLTKQADKAIPILKRALAIRQDKQDMINLSIALRQVGQVQEAMKYEALEKQLSY